MSKLDAALHGSTTAQLLRIYAHHSEDAEIMNRAADELEALDKANETLIELLGHKGHEDALARIERDFGL